jgi:lipoprotein-releasing system permease protein
MTLRFETYVALRYVRGKRKNWFISLITFISIAGVSVGVIALIVVMSVMTGFDNALREAIIGNRAHLTIFSRTGQPLTDYKQVMEQVKELSNDITAIGPIIQIEALLRYADVTTGAYVVGVDPELEKHITDLEENLSTRGGRQFGRGSLPGDKEIVLGYRLAQRLGVTLGDEIAVLCDRNTITPFGLRRGSQIWLRVCGISQAKMSDFDMAYAFVNLETARLLTGREGVDALHAKLSNPFLAEKIAHTIMTTTEFHAETWYESQQAFFDALRQEKLAMFIILTFIILVAAFNISSTLIMIVMEKRRDIGILRTLGAGAYSILRLFVIQGLIIGVTGTAIGVVFGTLLAYNINPVAQFLAWLFQVDLFNSVIYYFDGIPVAVVPSDIAAIALSAVALTFLSTLYPAWSAARLNPVDALRYE